MGRETEFAVCLVKNDYVSLRGNIWVDTSIDGKNKLYSIDELFLKFNK